MNYGHGSIQNVHMTWMFGTAYIKNAVHPFKAHIQILIRCGRSAKQNVLGAIYIHQLMTT